MGSDRPYFLYGETSLPVRFASFKDKTVLLISQIGVETVFNTLSLGTKERAARIISSNMIPELKRLYDTFKDTDLGYLGMVIAYGSKDFSEKSDVLNLKEEVVSLVVAKDTIQSFIQGEVTDNELVKNSSVFLSDRDMVFDVKKIEVELE